MDYSSNSSSIRWGASFLILSLMAALMKSDSFRCVSIVMNFCMAVLRLAGIFEETVSVFLLKVYQGLL